MLETGNEIADLYLWSWVNIRLQPWNLQMMREALLEVEVVVAKMKKLAILR